MNIYSRAAEIYYNIISQKINPLSFANKMKNWFRLFCFTVPEINLENLIYISAHYPLRKLIEKRAFTIDQWDIPVDALYKIDFSVHLNINATFNAQHIKGSINFQICLLHLWRLFVEWGTKTNDFRNPYIFSRCYVYEKCC